MKAITATTRAAVNVLAGWMGWPVPPMPKHRRRPHRKTATRRPRRKVER